MDLILFLYHFTLTRHILHLHVWPWIVILESRNQVLPLAVERARIRGVHVCLTAEFSTRQPVLVYFIIKNKNKITDDKKSRKFFWLNTLSTHYLPNDWGLEVQTDALYWEFRLFTAAFIEILFTFL